MSLNVLVVGKYFDNFTDLPSKQNNLNLYKTTDDDPSLLNHEVCSLFTFLFKKKFGRYLIGFIVSHNKNLTKKKKVSEC